MTSSKLADAYNREYLEAYYQRWLSEPTSVPAEWQNFFAGAEFAGLGMSGSLVNGGGISGDLRLQTGVVRLIFWYRQIGHLQAYTNPLAADAPPDHPLLKLENFGLSEADLDTPVDTSMCFGLGQATPLRDLLAHLKATYCQRIGVEFMHIDSLEKRTWLASQMEPFANRPNLDQKLKYRTLMTLHFATMFEQYLHTKYVGQKRFSLEGGETLMPMLDAIVEMSPSLGIKEIVIGMAHRGRLNVLANLLQKPFDQIFNEFEDVYLPETTKDGDGDVKYHMGFSADITTSSGGVVHLSLSPNPSHLEAVNPVVEGRVRAKQRQYADQERYQGVPLLIHGDAAFAGQGLVAETLNMANLLGYRTGGTVHIVVNNQIGFTTNHAMREAPNTARTSPSSFRHRFSTSMGNAPKKRFMSRSWHSNTARSSSVTSLLIWSATASMVTTKEMNLVSLNRSSIGRSKRNSRPHGSIRIAWLSLARSTRKKRPRLPNRSGNGLTMH